MTLIKLYIFFITIHFTTSAFCQISNLKWHKADLSYEKMSQFRQRNYSFDAETPGEFIKKSFVNAYWFFISDVDGDNCAFEPSCSAFFSNAIDETNIFQATVMFSDRLTRDLNPGKSNNYPREKSGHYFDPPDNYTLEPGKIHYLPPSYVVTDE